MRNVVLARPSGLRRTRSELPVILAFSVAGLLVSALAAVVAPGWTEVLAAWGGL